MKKREIIQRIRELRKILMLQDSNFNIYTGKIKYENEFVLAPEEEQYMGVLEKDIFIAEKYIKQEQMNAMPIKLLEIYNKDGEKIGHTTPIGELVLEDEYLENMRQKYGAFYEKIGIEKRPLYMHEIQQEIDDIEKSDIDEYIVTSSEELTQEEKEQAIQNKEKSEQQDIEDVSLVEESLEIDENQIEYSVDILDQFFYKEVLPEAKQYDGRAKMCKLKNGDIAVIGLKNGKYERIPKVGPLEKTSSKKIDLGQDGEEISRENMYYELAIEGKEDYKIAYKQGQYGLPEFQIARDAKLDGQRVSMDLHTRVTYCAEESTKDIINKRKNYTIVDEAEQFQRQVNKGDEEIQTDEITSDEKIQEQFQKEQEEEGDREKTIHDRGNKYYF